MNISSPLSNQVAIVTVTYNSKENIEKFITSFRQFVSSDQVIHVADNGSTDGTLEFLAALPHIDLHPMPTNLGYGTAINRVVAALPSSPQFILIANPDLIWPENTLDELIKVSKKYSQAALFGPAIYDLAGNIYPSARRFPSLFAGTGHAILSGIWANNPWSKRYRNYASLQHEGKVDWLSGACLLIRYTAWQQVQGFNEQYFMYLEDVDLCLRLANKGWERIFVPQTKVLHEQGHSAQKYKRRTLIAHHDSMKRFLNDKYAKVWQYPLRVAINLGLEIRKRYLLKGINENNE